MKYQTYIAMRPLPQKLWKIGLSFLFWHDSMVVLEDCLSGPSPIPRTISTFFVRYGILERKNRYPRWNGRLYRRISSTVLLLCMDRCHYSGTSVHRTATFDMEAGGKTRNSRSILSTKFSTSNSRMALYERRKCHVVIYSCTANDINY